MIIHDLIKYYNNNFEEWEKYFEETEANIITIDKDGNFVNVTTYSEKDENICKFLLPIPIKRTRNIKPMFLFDDLNYILLDDKKVYEFYNQIKNCELKELEPVVKFYEKEIKISNSKFRKTINELRHNFKSDNKFTFQIENDSDILFNNENVKNVYIKNYMDDSKESNENNTDVYVYYEKNKNNQEKIAKVHNNVWSRYNIIGFQTNRKSYESFFENIQGLNASISESVMLKYTKVLRTFSKDKKNSYILSKGEFLFFWDSDIKNNEHKQLNNEDDFENFLSNLVSGNDKDEDENNLEFVNRILNFEDFFKNIDRDEKEYSFLILQNFNNRLFVKYFNKIKIKDFLNNLKIYFKYNKKRIKYYNCLIKKILKKKTNEDDTKDILEESNEYNIKDILEGSKISNIFVNCIFKLYLKNNRNENLYNMIRYILYKNYNKEYDNMLMTENKDLDYNYGRLFAIMEKVKKDSVGEKSPLSERMIEFMSDKNVFAAWLMSYYNYYKKNLKSKVYYDKLITEIFQNIDGFKNDDNNNKDKNLIFLVGYYHQKSELYKSKK